MSIIPLSGIMQTALSFFMEDVDVQDVTYQKISGQDVPGAPVARIIQAAVDPSHQKRLEMIFGGSVADGDIGIYTADRLYVQDQGDEIQSYVLAGEYDQKTYRVMQAAEWKKQLGISVYLGRRHVTQQFT